MVRAVQAALCAAAVLASGCNLLLGLDPVTEVPADAAPSIDAPPGIDASFDAAPPPDAGPPDASPITGHDEDGDGVDDGIDVCPGLSDDQADMDGDRVGDACDPNAGAPGEELLFFDSFATDDGSWTGVRGTWSISDDSLWQTDRTVGGLAVNNHDLSSHAAITIEAVVRLVDQLPGNPVDGTAPRGVGLWFASTGGSAVTEPDGYLCQVLGDLIQDRTTFSMVRNVGAAQTQLDDDVNDLLLGVGAVWRIRAALPSGQGFELCTANLSAETILATLFATDGTYSSGRAALRTTLVHARFDSVTFIGSNP